MTSGQESTEQTGITLHTRAAAGTRAAARALATCLRAGDLLVLDGPLGAGKTTFTQGLGDGLGVRGPVASPTFVIARVYPSLQHGPSLVHVDSYRLAGGFDVDDLDLEAELDGAVTVVEWGRDQVEHLADSHLLIELDRGRDAEPALEPDDPDEPRRLRILPAGPRWDAAAMRSLRAALTAAGLDLEPAEPAGHDAPADRPVDAATPTDQKET